MKIKRFCALICGTLIILSSFSSCSSDVITGAVTKINEEKITTETQSSTQSKTTENKKNENKKPINKTPSNKKPSNKKPGNNRAESNTTQNNSTEVSTTEKNTTENRTTADATTTKPRTTRPSTTRPQSDYPYAYAGFNPRTITIDENNWNLTLLNRYYTLPENYKPKLAEAVRGSGVYLDYRVAPHYQKMYDAARKDGITLTPNSGYRSYQTQKTNFENRINRYISQGYNKVTATQNAARIILLPGTSEHNAGLAMDIGWVTQDFERSPAFAWLNAHAQDYGFILRYPKSEAKQAITEIIYEPWHWRYVGVTAAREMKASGQVLEEYLGIK